MTNPATRSTPIKRKTKIASTICESDAAICCCCSVWGVELFPAHWEEGGKVGGLFLFFLSIPSLHFTQRSDDDDDGMMAMKRCC